MTYSPEPLVHILKIISQKWPSWCPLLNCTNVFAQTEKGVSRALHKNYHQMKSPEPLVQNQTNYRTGRVAQSVTCRATDATDPGVASSIPARSHTFVEIDHEIISMVILLPFAECIIQEGLLSVTSESICTKYWLTACSSLPRKKCG